MNEKKKQPKLRFPGFTDDWEQRKFSEGVSEVGDGLHGTPTYCEDGIVYFVNGNNLVNGKIVITSETKTVDEQQQSAADKLLDNNTILMSINGTIGNLAYYSGEKIMLGKSAAYIKVSKFDKKFVYSYLQAPSIQGYFMDNLTGTTIKNLGLKSIREMKIIVPLEIDEQVRIGQYFDTLDHLITLHQRELDSVKKLKQSMLQKMFPRKGETVPELRFPGFTGAWEQRKVLDLLVQPVTDGPHETPELVEEGVPFISVDAIVDNKIDFNRKRGNISEEYDELCCKKYKPQLYDVYLVKSGSTVGKVAIVETTDRFNIWSPLAAMRCGDKTNPYFLYNLLQTKAMQAQVSDKASNGRQPNLSMRALEKFPVIVPINMDEQKKIGEYFSKVDNLITLHQRELEGLKKLKQAFLQQMFV